MLGYDVDLASLLTKIPNIRCLHVFMHNTYLFESPSWSSVVLPHLVEFYLWAEIGHIESMTELSILLHIMPAVRRLLFAFAAGDESLLDGEQIRSLLSTAHIHHLEKLDYAVDYSRTSLKHNTISDLQQKWLPQPIAIASVPCATYLYTIPFKFHRFWTSTMYSKAERSGVEQELFVRYGEGVDSTHCVSNIPRDLNNLYTVMQKCHRIRKPKLKLSPNASPNSLREYLNLIHNSCVRSF